MAKPSNAFVGKWRIVEMEIWDSEYIDLEVPGYIAFKAGLDGSFQFGTVRGWLDCRIEQVGDDKRIEFSWEGLNDEDPGCGRGWALLRGDELEGRLYIHAGDDSSFRARRASPKSGKRTA